MNKKRTTVPGGLTVAALFAPLLLVGCKQPTLETKAVAASVAPVAVKTAVVGTVKVPRTLTLSGNLIGSEQARVAAGATGKVLSTYVERGSVVRKGAVLAKLDARAASAMASEAAAQVESLKVQDAQAKIECERTQHLYDKGAIAKADFDKAHSACEAAKWSFAAAEARKTQTADVLNLHEVISVNPVCWPRRTTSWSN